MFRTAFISMFLTSTALADTWTVDDDGKADFDNIQAAIDAASDGDEIVVMPGTYTNSTASSTVINTLGKALWLHSSDGAEVTIIDGEYLRRGVACVNDEGNNTIIDGFTITHGYADDECDFGEEWTGGGGVLIYASSPTFVDCIITSNTVTGDPLGVRNGFCGFAGIGGGVLIRGYVTNNSNSSFINCEISNNIADVFGGGISSWYSNNTFILDNCLIQNNEAIVDAGGIELNNADGSMLNSTICGNIPNQIVGGFGGMSDEGGNFVGAICPLPGACCTNNNCTDSLEEDCLTFFGQWQGDGTICSENPCPSTCLGDITGDGIVDVSDLLVVIGVWGACP